MDREYINEVIKKIDTAHNDLNENERITPDEISRELQLINLVIFELEQYRKELSRRKKGQFRNAINFQLDTPNFDKWKKNNENK